MDHSSAWQLLFSGSVVSDCLRPHGLQHARLHCGPPGHEHVTHCLPADPPPPSSQLLPRPCPGGRRPCRLGAACACRLSRAACSLSLWSCRSCGQSQTLPPATAATRPRSGAQGRHPGNSSGPSRAGPVFQDRAPTLYPGTELLWERQGAGVISHRLMPGTTFHH